MIELQRKKNKSSPEKQEVLYIRISMKMIGKRVIE